MACDGIPVSITSDGENTLLVLSGKSVSSKRKMSYFKELTKLNFWRCVLLEYISTLLFVVNSCGSSLSLYKPNTGDMYPTPSHISISISTGWSAIVLVAIGRHVKGYFNPALTIGLCLLRNITVVRCIAYVIFQIAGAITGASLLYAFTAENIRGKLGTAVLHPDVSSGVGCVVEMIITFLIACTVLTTADSRHDFTGLQSPIAIGFSIAAGMLMSYAYTGAALNPARALAPALLMNNLDNQWLYWVGPILGASLATFSYKYLFTMTKDDDDEEEEERDRTLYMKINSSNV